MVFLLSFRDEGMGFRFVKRAIVCLAFGLAFLAQAHGEAMLQLFNLTWNQIADKMPEIAEAGYTALWLPPPAKANSQFSAGYDMFDPFDLGDKDQKGTIATRYGTKDDLLRMVKIAHRFGIRVYFDNIMNHRSYDVPGYDANTPITVYPGLLPEDFHLQVTADGFYRKWPNVSDWNNVWQIQNQNFSDLVDLSQESPNNYNFGPTLGTVSPKISWIRQPNNPDYYMDPTQPQIDPGSASWHGFNGTNGMPVAEDTASYEIRAALWEIDQTKCDGFRLDAVKHVPSFFFGDYGTATPNGYDGAIQVMFDWVHGYGYNNPISGYNEASFTNDSNGTVGGDDNRNSCYDTEAVRNDAMIFGEHLGQPPSFDDYLSRGMRLLDINLHNNLNNILGNPDYNSLQGYDQRDAGGFSSADRVMFVGTHDPGVSYTSQRALQLGYYFMREGEPSLYTDGYHQSQNCQQCGGAFPAIAYAPFLGEFGDDKMPEMAYLHSLLARGGTISRWSDQYTVAFERYDYREGNPNDRSSQVVMLFAMNDKLSYPGDIVFLDGIGDVWPGNDGIPPGAGGVAQGLAVDFPVGSVLYQLAASGPGADRTWSPIKVRYASNDPNWVAGDPANRVYVGNQTIPPNGGGIEFVIPSGGYVVYGYQGPQASRAGLKDAITLRQNGQDVPRLTVRRTDGPDGDQGWNPIYPFQMRGSVDPVGNVIGGQNVSNLTYAIDVPVVTNPAPLDLILRADASADNLLVKLDGGLDLNRQMGLGRVWTNTATGFIDARDNRPGHSYDTLLGYEQPAFQFRNGPEKFAALDISRNIVVSLGAETFSYTIGGATNVIAGSGFNTSNATAVWVYHNPADVTDLGAPMRAPVLPGAGQAVTLWVKVGYQGSINLGNVYYTTDGTPPEGSFGVPKPGTTTQVVPLQWSHTSSGTGGTYDWRSATLPAQSAGTVTYKIALYNQGINPMSDGDPAKLYGLTQFAITNFNPATALVWLHDDLNTNNTQIGLDPGYHIVRLRTFLPRLGKASVMNTFLQTFYYTPATPQGVIAFPNEGDTIYSPEYGVVVRADGNTAAVEYNILDGNSWTNPTSFLPATQVSPNPSLSQQYPNYPQEFRFNYTGVPANGTATITVRLQDVASGAFSNRYTTLVRHVYLHAPPVSLTIGFPAPDGTTISLDQNGTYQIAACFSNLVQDINKFTYYIDGSVQPRYAPDGTPLYVIQTTDAFCPPASLRYNWGGMSAGPHLITCIYSNSADGYFLQASRFVNVNLTGISVDIVDPAAADSQGRSPFTIDISTCTGGSTSTTHNVLVQTSPSVTNVLISIFPETNAFTGGQAIIDPSFTNTSTSVIQWVFPWTNLVSGTWVIRADATGAGASNTAFRTVNVDFSPIVAPNPNSDDSDNDGVSDYLEANQVPLPSTNPDTWQNSDVHVWALSGKSNPYSAHSDGDPNGLPDGLKLGIGPASTATNTIVPDPNCGGRSFIPSLDPPLYNTTDNANRPAGYDGYNPWPYDYNKSRTDQIAGRILNPLTPDTDGDGLRDAVEDMNHNGRLDITLTNANGTPLTSTTGLPGTTYDTVTLSNANGHLVITGYAVTWQYPDMAGYNWLPVGSAITTSIVVIAHPPTIYNTSIIDRVKVLQQWPNAVWLETDPANPDSDGDGLADSFENDSQTGFIKIGLLNRNIGYNAGSCGCPCVSNVMACVTNTLPTPLPASVLYWPLTSRINRRALIQQYPNAVLLETDPMDAHTDGDPNGLPDGWKIAHRLDPWDDGVIGHTNWHTGALITTNLNGVAGNPSGDGISNYTKYLNGMDPWLYYSNGVAITSNSITIGPGNVIGTAAGTTWHEELQGWSVNDLKVVRPYDGIGPNSNSHTIYPLWDGYDWSRDIVAFYAHDGADPNVGGDGNYYFRVDLHDLTFGADQQGRVSLYVAINFGVPGPPAETVFPENIGATTDMGWRVLAGIYGTVNGKYAANLYVKLPGSGPGVYETRGYQQPGGVQNQYWRADLDSIAFSIPRQALLDAGWSGTSPLYFQVFDTDGATRFGWRPAIVGTVYDTGMCESRNTGYGNTLHYWFSSLNQNPIGLSDYNTNNNIGSVVNRPNTAKVAIVLHANQADLPASLIQNLVSNAVTRTPSGYSANASYDPTYNPGNNPIGYYRALESAQVFGIPLNLHLSGSLIAALQWAKSDPALDPNGTRDGANFNQRIAALVAAGKASLISGMFADHIAPYFTGAVNRAGIQLQDDIMRSVYGSNSVTASTPVWLAEQVVDGPTLSDLAANSGHYYTLLDQMVHLWWWGDQLYGFGNGRLVALSDSGYQLNRFNGLNAFLISGASDQMYLNNDLGTSIALRELLLRRALSGSRDQVVILADNWETAGGVGGTSNPDNLNLNLRWIANHQWILPVRLDQFANGQIDMNNDGTINGQDFPYINDRGTANFSQQSKDYVRHACETNYDNWYYGSAQEQSFYNQHPIRSDGTLGAKVLGHVLTNGTVLADTWASVQLSTATLSNLAQLVYLNGIYETAFHNEDNVNDTRYSTGDYVYPDTTYDTLASFAYNPNARATRQAGIIAAASAWAASNSAPTPVVTTQDLDQDGEPEYILSNNRVYAVFSRKGGRLIAAFARDPVTGWAYEMIGNLVSTPEYTDPSEGASNVTGTPVAPLAYRTSGLKDWFAINSQSGNTNQYVNDLYTVSSAPGGTGWKLSSSDNRVTKTVTLTADSNKLEVGYKLTDGVSSLYVRHGVSPDLLSLLYQGQQYLAAPVDSGSQVSVRNNGIGADATVAVDYADSGHSNTLYNAAATDKDSSFTSVNMRNQAQTQQIELQGTTQNFSFALEFNVYSKGPTVDHVGDGIPDWWRALYFGGDGRSTNNLSCATCDPDGDGQPNAAEYAAGTSPIDPNSVLRIISVSRAGSNCTVTWASVAGKSYQVLTATDLKQTFSPMTGSQTTAIGPTSGYTHTNATDTTRFYKVQVLPNP